MAFGLVLFLMGTAAAQGALGEKCENLFDCETQYYCKSGICARVDDQKAGLGLACSSSCDCNWPLACDDGICSKTCDSHEDCDITDGACRGFYDLAANPGGAFCGADNTCRHALMMGNFCNDTVICPECSCDISVCDSIKVTGIFRDNLDGGKPYCRGGNCGCYHDGMMPSYEPYNSIISPEGHPYYCIDDWKVGDTWDKGECMSDTWEMLCPAGSSYDPALHEAGIPNINGRDELALVQKACTPVESETPKESSDTTTLAVAAIIAIVLAGAILYKRGH